MVHFGRGLGDDLIIAEIGDEFERLIMSVVDGGEIGFEHGHLRYSILVDWLIQ